MQPILRKQAGFFLFLPTFLVLLGCDLFAATTHHIQIELTETTFRLLDSGAAEVTYHQKLKALTAQGRAAVSQIRVPFVAGFEDAEIKFIKTLKTDGSTISGDPASAFDAASSGDPLMAFFTDLKMKTVLAPNVETGDSVEYEAVLYIRKWSIPGEFWFEHFLTQRTDSDIVAENVILDLPASRKVALYQDGAFPGKVEVANGRRVERWTIANTDAKQRSPEGAQPLFVVSSLLTWDAFGEWMRSLNKSAIEPNPEITALAARLTANKSTEQERIAALYTYVATKVRYVGVEFGTGRYQPHTAAVVLHNAYGDCKDQSALLTALLTAAGFKAYPVLTKVGEGVRAQEVPSPEQFNHEFTAVETKDGIVFLDTAMGPVPPQVLQPGVRGRTALLIRASGASVIDIPIQSPVATRISLDLKGRVTLAGAFEGSIRCEYQGIVEVLRRLFLDATEADKEKLIQGLAGSDLQHANVRQISTSDPGDLTKPFWIQAELHADTFFPASKTSQFVGLALPSPPAALFAEMQKPERPFPIESFQAAINMDLIVDTSLTISNQMPTHRKFAFGTYDSEFSYDKDHLKLESMVKWNSGPIAPSDWGSFIDFFQSLQEQTPQGFTLERHTSSVPSTPSAPGRLSTDGAEAFRRRDYEAAKSVYLEQTRLDPQSKTAWNNLGRTYAALHDYSDAEAAYKRQIAINPKDQYAYNNLGLVYRALKREDDAIAQFQKQITVNPRDPVAHTNLFVSFAARSDWERARAEASIAADINPENAVKWSQLAQAQIKTGQIDQAEKSIERALAVVHDAVIENNLAYFMADAGIQLDKSWQLVSGTLNPELGRVCQPEGLSKEDKCAPQLRRIGEMLDTAGWNLYRQSKFNEAEPYLRSAYAINLRPTNELHLVVLLAKTGRFDEAVKFFAKVRSRQGFERIDSSEARRELVKAAGGEAELDAELKKNEVPFPDAATLAKIIALVDEHGKVIDAQAADAQTPDSLVDLAKSQTLIPLISAEHPIRTTRTLEFRREGSMWVFSQSHVGQP